MFTGIVEETGTVISLRRGARSFTLTVAAHKVLEDTQIGDSIATNGVCLTVTKKSGETFSADVMPETVERSSLRELTAGASVNLERALTPTSRLGGHLVTGHVDGTGRIIDLLADDNALWLTIECPSALLRHIVEKGSITVQGVSLTVARVSETSFSVSLIPHTLGATTLHNARRGDMVNLETDIIAKYVEKMLGCGKESNVMETLSRCGFL